VRWSLSMGSELERARDGNRKELPWNPNAFVDQGGRPGKTMRLCVITLFGMCPIPISLGWTSSPLYLFIKDGSCATFWPIRKFRNSYVLQTTFHASCLLVKREGGSSSSADARSANARGMGCCVSGTARNMRLAPS
jgi:hypothetical protein